ncbi:helix-turn-helix transcriptional regulator [Streptomyces litchfieldiae]
MLDGVVARGVSPVFVGRGPELAELTEGLARAREGEPQAFVVGGEAGIGKTRLLEEFLARARASGAVTAVGACVELGADGLPFAPVAAVLRSLHRQFGTALTEAATGQEDELARLLPELGVPGQPAGDATDRARLFELTTRLLERLAADDPLIIAIEDLHWSDRSTRELMRYLFRSVQRAKLVLVATYRADDIHRRHPLRPFLAELDRLRSVRRIELARFTRSEVSAQMAAITGSRPRPGLLGSVFERSEGNPFFVEELTAGGPGSAMSETLRDLLLVRVEALPEDVQDVLRTVAEGGSSVEHGLLAEVARRPEPELLDALRAAVGAHLLAPTEEGDGYRFRHALMREAVVDDLLPGERARLNRRFAEALERTAGLVPGDQRAARLASYWYHAGDRAKALPAVLEAAAQAHRRYAYAEQLRLLERALELWDGVPPEVLAGLRPIGPVWGYPAAIDGAAEPVGQVDVLAEATRAGVLSGQPERALAMAKRALRLLGERDEPLRAAWFWTQRAWLAEGPGRGDGRRELDRARELVRGLPPSVVHAQVLALDAARRSAERPGPEMLETAERAVQLARLVEAESTELYARVTLACLRADSGEIAGGVAELFTVLDRILERGEVSLLGRCLVNLVSVLSFIGHLARADQVAAEGLRLAERYGLENTKGWLSANHAQVLIELGRWDAAEAALAAAARARGVQPRIAARVLAGHLAALTGDLAAARAALAATHAETDTTDLRPSFVIELAVVGVETAAAEGRFEDARDVFRAATAEPFPSFTTALVWNLLIVAARAEALTRGLPASDRDRPAAVARIRRVLKSMARTTPMWAAFGHLVEAQVLRAEGRDTAAHWETAVAALEELGLPHHLAEARLGRAEALLAEGRADDRERVAELLRLVRAATAELGAEPLRQRAEQLATRARIALSAPARAAVPAPADQFGLTPRERDVLALVAAGRSNRQIAEELFISPKTASVHVSNILAKLEVPGRGEAAALAHRLGLVPAG